MRQMHRRRKYRKRRFRQWKRYYKFAMRLNAYISQHYKDDTYIVVDYVR